MALAAALLATSCVTPRRVNYLQNLTQGDQITIENRFEAVIAHIEVLFYNRQKTC